jgi:hypothetical protein
MIVKLIDGPYNETEYDAEELTSYDPKLIIFGGKGWAHRGKDTEGFSVDKFHTYEKKGGTLNEYQFVETNEIPSSNPLDR